MSYNKNYPTCLDGHKLGTEDKVLVLNGETEELGEIRKIYRLPQDWILGITIDTKFYGGLYSDKIVLYSNKDVRLIKRAEHNRKDKKEISELTPMEKIVVLNSAKRYINGEDQLLCNVLRQVLSNMGHINFYDYSADETFEFIPELKKCKPPEKADYGDIWWYPEENDKIIEVINDTINNIAKNEVKK